MKTLSYVEWVDYITYTLYSISCFNKCIKFVWIMCMTAIFLSICIHPHPNISYPWHPFFLSFLLLGLRRIWQCNWGRYIGEFSQALKGMWTSHETTIQYIYTIYVFLCPFFIQSYLIMPKFRKCICLLVKWKACLLLLYICTVFMTEIKILK